jgi:hypothetical protein
MFKRSLIALSGTMISLLAPNALAGGLERIKPSPDGSHFVLQNSGETVAMWGFNYDRDDNGRLLEDYWGDEWATVADDFREMKALGGRAAGTYRRGSGRPSRGRARTARRSTATT